MAIPTIHVPSAETATAVATYLLRLTQLSFLSISCYGVCYLIWLHNHHYCTYYSCSDSNREAASVPVGEVVYTVACVLAGLEWIYATSSTLVSLSRGKRPDSFTHLCCAWTSVAVLAVGIGMFTSISTVRQAWPLCYSTGYIQFSSYYPPETNSCIVTQNAVTTGLIGIICSLLLGILAVLEVRRDLREGRMQLPLRAAGRGESDHTTEPEAVAANGNTASVEGAPGVGASDEVHRG